MSGIDMNSKENTNADEQFNYSPDTSLLLSYGIIERSDSDTPRVITQNIDSTHITSLPQIEMMNPNTYFESSKEKMDPNEQMMNGNFLNNIPVFFDFQNMSVLPVPDGIIPQHQSTPFIINHPMNHISLNQIGTNQMSLSQIPMNHQVTTSGNNDNLKQSTDFQNPFNNYNLNYINQFCNQQQNLQDNTSGIIGNIIQSPPPPISSFNLKNTFTHTPRSEIGGNIYVSKASAKLSEAEDWTPNPVRLLDILGDLGKLTGVINQIKDECDVNNTKPSIKRERNRLASKACRLKKKAAHETNKIKLEGLEVEFKLLILALHAMSYEMVLHLNSPNQGVESLSSKMREIRAKFCSVIKVAGDSDNFVKHILERSKLAANAALPFFNFSHVNV